MPPIIIGNKNHVQEKYGNTVTVAPPPPSLIYPKPIAELTLSDFLRGKRLRNPTHDFYFRRVHDDVLKQHLTQSHPILIIGDSLVGKTRAVFESLKTPSDNELLIVKQEHSPKTLSPTPTTFVFFDDIEEFFTLYTLSEVRTQGFLPDVVTYSSIIKHTKNYTDAMKVVTLMGEARIRPDAHTLSTVINKLGRGEVKRMRELLEQFRGMKVRVNDFVITQIQRKFKITIDKNCREARDPESSSG
jgi:hypothetical protein